MKDYATLTGSYGILNIFEILLYFIAILRSDVEVENALITSRERK